MAIGNDNAWRTAFADMPVVSDSSWKGNLANTLGDLVDGLLSSPGLFNPSAQPAAVFTFGRAAFQSALSGNTAAVISSAFNAGLTASTVVVATGSYVGSLTPATTFSVVATAILDPASVALAVAEILTIEGKTPVADPMQSAVPPVFRSAFLKLTMTTTGTNSVVPPAGPNPLTDAARSMA